MYPITTKLFATFAFFLSVIVKNGDAFYFDYFENDFGDDSASYSSEEDVYYDSEPIVVSTPIHSWEVYDENLNDMDDYYNSNEQNFPIDLTSIFMIIYNILLSSDEASNIPDRGIVYNEEPSIDYSEFGYYPTNFWEELKNGFGRNATKRVGSTEPTLQKRIQSRFEITNRTQNRTNEESARTLVPPVIIEQKSYLPKEGDSNGNSLNSRQRNYQEGISYDASDVFPQLRTSSNKRISQSRSATQPIEEGGNINETSPNSQGRNDENGTLNGTSDVSLKQLTFAFNNNTKSENRGEKSQTIMEEGELNENSLNPQGRTNESASNNITSELRSEITQTPLPLNDVLIDSNNTLAEFTEKPKIPDEVKDNPSERRSEITEIPLLPEDVPGSNNTLSKSTEQQTIPNEAS